MDHKSPTGLRIFQTNALDFKDELEEKFARSQSIVSKLIDGLSDRESHDKLQNHSTKGNNQYEEVQIGLLMFILHDAKRANKHYRDMSLISHDGINVVLTNTNRIIHEKWSKLNETARVQLLWFSKELMKNNIRGADTVFHSFIRQIAGGDVSQKNVWLAENVLDIFTENKAWLEKHTHLMCAAVYSYLRIIIDHGNPQFHVLRQREVEFCVTTLRDKWNDCQQIGRDLMRLLQYVARIPEFEKLWRDILFNPSALHPQFKGVQQLMQTRTSRYYLVSRLTPDMETKLGFLTTKVRFGQHKRYQDWFQKQYLSTAESQSLRCDLIRYICAVIHPSNEILCSDIIPRWAVIGWLLTTCTSNVAASNAKLSLFYDWLFFDPERESIMNIEPCILVMFHSMRPHPAITATLLDFMCRIMTNFSPTLAAKVKSGIYTALKVILEKRVLQSLSPLFDNPKLDKELRAMLKENFTEFCSQDDVKPEPNNGETLPDDNHSVENNSLQDVAEFSDEEEEMAMADLKNDIKFMPIKEPSPIEQVDISEHIEQLEGPIKTSVVELQSDCDNNEMQCEVMDRLVQLVIQEDPEPEMVVTVATCICSVLRHHFTCTVLPTEIDDDAVEDSIGRPLYVIFRNLCQTPEEDPARQPILLLLEEMYNKQPRIGYHFLYFLKVSKVHDERMSTYKDFCNNMETRDLATCLKTDLKLCVEDDVRLFTFLLPDVFTQFPNIAVGSAELMNLIVSNIDGAQLQDLICQILQGHLVMFKKDSFISILNSSLDWETIEQFFLWQLISGHNMPVEQMMPILPKLEYCSHAEALSSILLLLKQDGPNNDLIRPILCRECKKNDMFTISILKFWAQEYEDKLADLLLNQLTRSANTPNRKRKGNQRKEKENPTPEQILSHLEHMRQRCRNISFLTNESIQQALQHIQATSSETLKTKYSELLALAEDLDDVQTTRVLRAVPSRRASQSIGQLTAKINTNEQQQRAGSKKKAHPDDSDSDSDSSDDEEKPPKRKKMKKQIILIDDDSE